MPTAQSLNMEIVNVFLFSNMKNVKNGQAHAIMENVYSMKLPWPKDQGSWLTIKDTNKIKTRIKTQKLNNQ